MDWIKKNYEQFTLLVIALALLVSSALLIMRARAFDETFAGIKGQVIRSDKVEPVDLSALEEAASRLRAPPTWKPGADAGSLFVSEKLLVVGGDLTPVSEGGATLHPPVPNKWFLDHNLDLLQMDILREDTDKDGFDNMAEYEARTDPQDPKSHPPLTGKLFLANVIRVPFPIRFQSYDGDLNNPESVTVQIDFIDRRRPTQFVKIGAPIEGTPFKVTGIEAKSFVNENGVTIDTSELMVENTETQQKVQMVLRKPVDSPESYAVFKYLLDGSEIKVKPDQTFTLAPEEDVEYKLIDIGAADATIENLKTKELIKISPLRRSTP